MKIEQMTVPIQMVNITKRQGLLSKLDSLSSDDIPEFGIMTPQHMVEHLTESIKYSNNRNPQKLLLQEEMANKIKSLLIYSENEMPLGFKSPMLGDDLINLVSMDLLTAIEDLQEELNRFDNYFVENNDSKPISPLMGELQHEEWITFHNKHFTHHFKQFRLL